MTEPTIAPPRLARWLLRRTLDGPARSAILGDLDEEFARFIVPRLGPRAASRWYWRQAIASIASCLRNRSVANREPDEPISRVRDIMQDSRGLGTDMRAAVRFCFRSPLTSIAVILTLAIGVGASTAVFSLLNAAFFKPLPIANADRLVIIRSKTGGSFSYAEALDVKSTAGLSAAMATGRTSVTMGEGQARRRVTVDLVSANYFEALGTPVARRGRLLTAGDGAAGSTPVVVVSDTFWRELGGADVVGTSVRLKQGFFTIVGIAPPGFSGTHVGFSPDLWLPLEHAPIMEGHRGMFEPGAGWLNVLGILERPDSLPIAREAISASWRAAGTRDEAILTKIPRGTSVFDMRRSAVQLQIFGLFVVLILMIACLNVATLLGGIVHERRKELAIRSSLGAGRTRLLRQLLLEHVMLAAAGGIIGGIVGVWLSHALASLIAGPFVPGDLDVRADANVVLFTVALSIIVAVAVGLLPAVRWSRVNMLVDLQGGSTGVGRLRRAAGLWGLIPWQVALGTVLLASAGALAKTVHELKAGIVTSSPERVWFANLHVDADTLTQAGFEDLQLRLRSHLAAMPGAETAGISRGRPLASSARGPLLVEGMTTIPQTKPMPFGGPPPPPPPPAKKGGQKPTNLLPPSKRWLVSNNYVSPGFFTALALPIVRGRDFTEADALAAQKVAIVNETLAAAAFGTGDPIGRRVAWAGSDAYDIVIVGVVRDLRSEHLREAAPDAIFFPLAQAAMAHTVTQTPTSARDSIDLTLVLRAGESTRVSSEQLQRHVLAFDPRLFVDRVWTFDEEAGRQLTLERLLALAGSVLGAIAIALMIVGLYGTLAAAVVRGRRELGIRLALGATPGSVRGMIVARSLAVALAGLAIGLPLSYVSARSFAHLLYGVRPVEPLVTATIVAIVLATAALSAYLPARRAARVDPLIALRND